VYSREHWALGAVRQPVPLVTAMPRFYFDFRNSGGEYASDEDGLLFADLTEAKTEASSALTAYGAEVLPGTNDRYVSVRIRLQRVVLCEITVEIRFADSQPRP